jgi:hypothetical protein
VVPVNVTPPPPLLLRHEHDRVLYFFIFSEILVGALPLLIA